MEKFGKIHFVAVLFSLCVIAAILSQRPVVAQALDIDLIHKVFVWKPYSAAIVSQNDTELNIFVVTNYTEKLWNRAYLPLQINSTDTTSTSDNFGENNLVDELVKTGKFTEAEAREFANDTTFDTKTFSADTNTNNNSSLLFNLEYATLSDLGNATFLSEVRDNLTDTVLWSSRLNNTSGQVSNNVFTLPSTMLNIPVEFRFYIITNGTGQHDLDVKKATLTIR